MPFRKVLDRCFYLVVKCFWCCWFRMRSRNTKIFWGILSRTYSQSPQYLAILCSLYTGTPSRCPLYIGTISLDMGSWQAIFYALNLNTLCGCNPEIYYKKYFFCAPYIVLSKTSYTLVRANLWTDKNLKKSTFQLHARDPLLNGKEYCNLGRNLHSSVWTSCTGEKFVR